MIIACAETLHRCDPWEQGWSKALETRRLVQLTIGGGEVGGENAEKMMDMLLSKKRAADRKSWLESKGNKVEI